jgi:uncharacterized protein YjbJ (UPF0337 family)
MSVYVGNLASDVTGNGLREVFEPFGRVETANVVKGRIEEAAGVLTGNDRLRARGRTDQAVRHVKHAAERGARQARESAWKIVDKTRTIARNAAQKAKRRSYADYD